MTPIAEDTLHFRARFMNILRRLPHKLFAALDHYGETRIHHAVSRSQLRRAQHDLIRLQRTIHAQDSGGLHKKAELNL